jgi:dephospho-CoA kinase
MKRITFITGHYGSGKSEFAVNLAISEGANMIVDLDIINPYFRSRELARLLEEKKRQPRVLTLKRRRGKRFAVYRERGIPTFFRAGHPRDL